MKTIPAPLMPQGSDLPTRAGCDCADFFVERTHRRWWMRLLPYSRLYRCRACGAERMGFRQA